MMQTLTKREIAEKIISQIPTQKYVHFSQLLQQARGKLTSQELRKFLGEAVKLGVLERLSNQVRMGYGLWTWNTRYRKEKQ